MNYEAFGSFGLNWILISIWFHFPNESSANHQYHMAVNQGARKIDENEVENVNRLCNG